MTDLIEATPSFKHLRCRLHYGSDPEIDDFQHADVNSVDELAKLGCTISGSTCDLVSLQHEFGIWGGREGENIYAFLDNLTKPLLSVLHTTFMPSIRSRVQTDIILRLITQSVRVIVLTKASKAAAEALYGRAIPHMVVVPHGVPDVPYVAPPGWLIMNGRKANDPIRLITPGFLRPDKGLEYVLHAIQELRCRGYEIAYRIAGESQRQFPEQESYSARLKQLISSLELRSVVEIEERYLSVAEQLAAIQQCHLGVFPYQVSSWASSGTVPLVLCAGRPVLCTPFEYAKVKAEEHPGVFLTADFAPAAIASGIEEFIRADHNADLGRAVYESTRHWTWATIGKTISDVYLGL